MSTIRIAAAQIAPVFLNREATTEKAYETIAQPDLSLVGWDNPCVASE